MSDEKPPGYRGTGMYVRGGFRIPAFSLSFDAKTGELLSGSQIVPEVRTETFDHWLGIARRAADEAVEAREEGVNAPLENNEVFGPALEKEFRAGMVAVGAAAFAADAFYASVIEHAPGTRVKANSRNSTVFETLKRAFRLSSAQQAALDEPLRLLYRLRDMAVHPPASWVKPVAHPVYGLGMEPRLVHFRMENAVNARLLVHKMIHVCMRCPKKQHSGLVEWCEAHKELVDEPEFPPDFNPSV